MEPRTIISAGMNTADFPREPISIQKKVCYASAMMGTALLLSAAVFAIVAASQGKSIGALLGSHSAAISITTGGTITALFVTAIIAHNLEDDRKKQAALAGRDLLNEEVYYPPIIVPPPREPLSEQPAALKDPVASEAHHDSDIDSEKSEEPEEALSLDKTESSEPIQLNFKYSIEAVVKTTITKSAETLKKEKSETIDQLFNDLKNKESLLRTYWNWSKEVKKDIKVEEFEPLYLADWKKATPVEEKGIILNLYVEMRKLSELTAPSKPATSS